jgi:hypothetical protein
MTLHANAIAPSATLASMRHASQETLLRLAPLLEKLRALEGLVEKRPGVFYRRSKAFLHFHDDPEGIFVDVRLRFEDPFTRLPVTTREEQTALVTEIQHALALSRTETPSSRR